MRSHSSQPAQHSVVFAPFLLDEEPMHAHRASSSSSSFLYTLCSLLLFFLFFAIVIAVVSCCFSRSSQSIQHYNNTTSKLIPPISSYHLPKSWILPPSWKTRPTFTAPTLNFTISHPPTLFWANSERVTRIIYSRRSLVRLCTRSEYGGL